MHSLLQNFQFTAPKYSIYSGKLTKTGKNRVRTDTIFVVCRRLDFLNEKTPTGCFLARLRWFHTPGAVTDQ